MPSICDLPLDHPCVRGEDFGSPGSCLERGGSPPQRWSTMWVHLAAWKGLFFAMTKISTIGIQTFRSI